MSAPAPHHSQTTLEYTRIGNQMQTSGPVTASLRDQRTWRMSLRFERSGSHLATWVNGVRVYPVAIDLLVGYPMYLEKHSQRIHIRVKDGALKAYNTFRPAPSEWACRIELHGGGLHVWSQDERSGPGRTLVEVKAFEVHVDMTGI
jgi:hypothetical protein